MSDQEKIYQVVASIPRGHLCSYGDVARLAGQPGRARWVGTLLSRLPEGSRLPWFRVVNSQGKISFAEGSEGFHRQLKKLLAEGSAEASGKLHWRQCRWPG